MEQKSRGVFQNTIRDDVPSSTYCEPSTVILF